MDDRTFTLIGRLRAKADSTTFPAEAESFRAKAVMLTACHRILDKATPPEPKPVAPRNPVAADMLMQFIIQGPFRLSNTSSLFR